MAMPLFIQSEADGYWGFFPQFGCFVFVIANSVAMDIFVYDSWSTCARALKGRYLGVGLLGHGVCASSIRR